MCAHCACRKSRSAKAEGRPRDSGNLGCLEDSFSRATITLMTKRRMGYFSLLVFFGALQFYLTIYINSSAITEALGQSFVTPVFVVAALASLALFVATPHILSSIGNRWMFVALSACVGGALLVLASAPGGVALFVALALYLACVPLIALSLDIFFERNLVEEKTAGTSHGLYLTAGNTALVLSPLMVSLLAGVSFSLVYLTATVFLIVFLLVALPLARSFRDPVYTHIAIREFPQVLSAHGPVIGAQFILRVFYAFATIYMPLLLIERGFSWGEIGVILSIALLPFVLFELPLGRIADTLFGEKEMLIAGFILLACVTSLLALSLPLSVPLYALIFFATRTGAAMIEITTETNFFRRVGAADSEAITLFRMTQSGGYLCGALIGALILFFTSLPSLFVGVALLVLCGIPFAYKMQDSR